MAQPNLRIKVGTYTGSGAARVITGLGFQPDFVLVKGGANPAVWRVASTKGAGCLYVGAYGGAVADAITAMAADGFALGTAANANANGTVYHYLAIAGRPGQDIFRTGLYRGDGVDNRRLYPTPPLPAAADFLMTKALDAATYGVCRAAGMAGDLTAYLSATAAIANSIQEVLAGGFELGSNGTGNNAGSLFHWLALANRAGIVKAGVYAGITGITQTIDVGFQPDFVLINQIADGGTTQWPYVLTSTMAANAALNLGAAGALADVIEALTPEGFRTGEHAAANKTGCSYLYLAIKAGDYSFPADNAAAGQFPALIKTYSTTAYLAIGRDPTQLYLNAGGGQLYGMDAARNIRNLYNFAGKYVIRVWETWAAGTVLALVQTGLDVEKTLAIHQSTDYGLTFGAATLLLGDGNGPAGAQVTDVSALAGGFCRIVRGGAKKILLGEYNVHTKTTIGGADDRANGSTNDRVRLMESADNGATWAALGTWNTDGVNNNVRHIHAVAQNPYTGEIFVTFGDVDAQAGILKWDGATAWTEINNVNLSHVDRTHAGFVALHSAQRYRTCNLLFEPDAVIWGADTPTAGEAGIWHARPDLSGAYRIDSAIEATGHLLMYAARSPKNAYMLSGLYNPTTNRYLRIYSARRPGQAWLDVGRFQMRAGSSADLPFDCFWWNGLLWISSQNLADTNRATFALAESGTTAQTPSPVFYGA